MPLLEAQLWSEGPDRFGDLWHYHALFQYLHTSAFFTSQDRFAYPAPLAVIYAWLYSFGERTHLVFNLLLASSAFLSAALFFHLLRTHRVATRNACALTLTLLLTSYPWHTLYDRGNLELFVYIGLAAGVWAYLRNRPMLAAVLWGCTGALKLYPLVVLLVLLHRKTLWAFVVGACSGAATLLASCWYVGPTVVAAMMGSVHGVAGFLGHYAGSARRSELNQDHTILGAIKEVLSLNMLHLGQNWPHLGMAYEATVLIVAPVIYLRWMRRLPLLNQLCLLLIALELLPPVSYDYTLIHSYLVVGIVTAAYLAAIQRGEVFPQAKTFFAAFAVLATSQTWIELRGMRVNGILKCAALLLICLLLLKIPLTIHLKAEGPATVK
ncbi:glycosyltransferase 87 family protein [Granulicella sp. 5B5]|uniref:glycosyltransferase 87 family protein n=1 Tax=Granulicella sp. 5B5 TaxID=1617967 RepID=UPI0015F3E210|nr:glycosyltransferase 87 family protein [Granulicella sp. 5B5]